MLSYMPLSGLLALNGVQCQCIMIITDVPCDSDTDFLTAFGEPAWLNLLDAACMQHSSAMMHQRQLGCVCMPQPCSVAGSYSFHVTAVCDRHCVLSHPNFCEAVYSHSIFASF